MIVHVCSDETGKIWDVTVICSLFSAVKAQDSIVQSTELNNVTTLYNMIVHVLFPMGQDSGYWLTSPGQSYSPNVQHGPV